MSLFLWKDLKAATFPAQTGELIEKVRKLYDDVGNVPRSKVSVENIIKNLAEADTILHNESEKLTFPQHFHTEKDVRDAAVVADKKFSEFSVELSMRQDIFDNLVALQKMSIDMDSETKRFLERKIIIGKRNGLHLDKSTQNEIMKIKKELSVMAIEFENNISEENEKLHFSQDELSGLSNDFIESLDRTDDGKLIVTLQYPHYFAISKKCRNPETRKRLQSAFDSRCKDVNKELLEKMVVLRQKKADLLGYKNHSAFQLELRMAKTPEAVAKFLKDLASNMESLRNEEFELYLQYKKDECEKYNYVYDGKINMWDMKYYMNMVCEKKYSVDQEKLKEYFPLQKVVDGMLHIYQILLGLKFHQIKDPNLTWHPDVTIWSVTDESSNSLLGYFYLDLYPRDGKFTHAAVFCLQTPCERKNGEKDFAIAAMLANFTKPTIVKPSLLDHDEVETIFHEFGHIMHDICGNAAKYSFFGGAHVERDFVEAPSQMLENWVWQEESLKIMSEHYKTKEPIPTDLMKSLIESRKANAGIFNLRQIALAMFDQNIHTKSSSDVTADYAEATKTYMSTEQTEGTCMPASFGHMAGGYDALYYGYLWSEVFSADMFASKFKVAGLLNKEIGMQYRKCIIEPGGTIDAKDMLVNFLGREPNQEAFLDSKGVKKT